MIAIEFQQRLQPALDVNIYNLQAGSIGAHLTGRRMEPLNPPDTYPTVIVADFNLRPPDWEAIITEGIRAMKAMAEWLQDTSLSLLVVHNYPEFHHYNHIPHSVCELTVANARAIGRLLVSRRKVDEEARTDSDDAVMRYIIANKESQRANWSENAQTG